METIFQDYSKEEVSVAEASMKQLKYFKQSGQIPPNYIIWGQRKVQFTDRIMLPSEGKIICQIMKDKFEDEALNAFDLKFEDGYILLEKGEVVKHLRTWGDSQYEPRIEYFFKAKPNSLLFISNVSKIKLPNGKILIESRIGNSSFCISNEMDIYEKTFNCNHYTTYPPTFDDFVFSFKLIPTLV